MSFLFDMLTGALSTLFNIFIGLEPIQIGLSYMAWSNMPFRIPDPDILILARMRKIITPEQYRNLMKFLGYHPNTSEVMYLSNLALPDLTTLISLYFRKEITLDRLQYEASKLGYDKDTLELILKSYEYYPTPSDLITFAVREAYSPDAIRTFGLLQDLPEEFVRDAEKVGMKREWAEKYWASHWRLPSIEQAFEMYHRGVINWDELNILLKAHDIMPYFREKLLKITYNPYTRVDARRMYAMGVLSEEEVYRNFLDLGYDPDHARKLTEWVKLSVLEDVKTISKSQIQELWEAGDLSDEEAVKYLMYIGYDEESAKLIKTVWEHERANKEIKNEIARLKAMYRAGLISESQLYDGLTALGLSSGRLNKEYADAVKEKRVESKIPSKEDLLKWVKLDIITLEEYFERMSQIGYSREDSLRYLVSDVRLPSKAELDKLFKAKLLTEDEYVFYMRKLKYSDKEIEKFLRLLYQQMGVVEEVGAQEKA